MHYAMLSPTLALLLAFLALPAVYVGWLSLHASTYGQSASFVGVANYAQIFADPIFWRAFWNTFFLVNGVQLTGKVMSFHFIENAGVTELTDRTAELLSPTGISGGIILGTRVID